MIRCETTRFGVLELADDAEIKFPRGIIGFSSETRFVILEREKGPISYLQSLKTPGLALPIVDASRLSPTYPDVARGDLADMAGIDERELAVMVVLAIDDADLGLRANLLAPIVVCANTRVGAQIILDHNQYAASVPIGERPDAGGRMSTQQTNSVEGQASL